MFRFELQPSFYLATLLLVIHGGAIVIVLLLALLWWLKGILVLLCLASFGLVLCQHVLLWHSKAVIKVWKTVQNDWCLQDKHGQVWTARLCDDSVCTLHFALLNFKLANKSGRRFIMVFSDSLDKASFRHLRVVFNN